MHAPQQRIVPGARAAVLFIHGISGTPRFWDAYLAAIPADFSVVNLLLPGHGGTVQDFGRVARGTWRQHVHDALTQLRATHPRVYLVGHSMGALLSILEATDDPASIAGLLLLAPALRIRAKPTALWQNLLRGLGLGESPEVLAQFYGVAPDWRLWRYIGWIPRYLELFSLARQARQELPRLAIPTRVFRHGLDELVSPRISGELARYPCAQVETLPASGHHAIAPDDRNAILAALREMCAD